MQMIGRWEVGARYLGKAVPGEIAIRSFSTGTRYIEVLLTVTEGPLLAERIRWRGYINSRANVQKTVEELRAMGWRGREFGDWIGIGSRVVQFQCMGDESQDGEKRYARAAFVQRPYSLSKEGRIDKQEVDALNDEFADLLQPPDEDVDDAAQSEVPPPGSPYASSTGNQAPPRYEGGSSTNGDIPF